MDEKRVRQEMIVSLGMWAVGEYSHEHRHFRNLAIDTALQWFRDSDWEKLDLKSLKKQSFPKDVTEALRLLLTEDMKSRLQEKYGFLD